MGHKYLCYLRQQRDNIPSFLIYSFLVHSVFLEYLARCHALLQVVAEVAIEMKGMALESTAYMRCRWELKQIPDIDFYDPFIQEQLLKDIPAGSVVTNPPARQKTIQLLVQEDPTYSGATKPMSHD